MHVLNWESGLPNYKEKGDQVKIEYIYHSGYMVETDEAVLIFDYYKEGLPEAVANSGKKVIFFVSHSHPDHFNPEIFDHKGIFVVSSDVPVPAEIKAYSVDPGDHITIGEINIRVLGSTDAGVSFLVRTERTNLFHAGDLNYWHWKEVSTSEEIADAKKSYLSELSGLAEASVDVAMFPVDPRMGKDFDEGARMFVSLIRPEIFLPMHFGDHPERLIVFRTWLKDFQQTKGLFPQKKHEQFEI